MSFLKIDMFIKALRTIRKNLIVHLRQSFGGCFEWKNSKFWLFSKIDDKNINLLTSAHRSRFSIPRNEGFKCRKFRVTASDGKSYDTKHYNLKVMIVPWKTVRLQDSVRQHSSSDWGS